MSTKIPDNKEYLEAVVLEKVISEMGLVPFLAEVNPKDIKSANLQRAVKKVKKGIQHLYEEIKRSRS